MLFTKKSKKEEGSEKVKTSSDSQVTENASPTISVKVLGSGCPKCNRLEQAAMQALEELKIDATVEHVTDYGEIASYGVMSTPALVINETVVSSGQALSVKQVSKLILQIIK